MPDVHPQAKGVGKGQLFTEGGKWMALDMQVEGSQACMRAPVPARPGKSGPGNGFWAWP